MNLIQINIMEFYPLLPKTTETQHNSPKQKKKKSKMNVLLDIDINHRRTLLTDTFVVSY